MDRSALRAVALAVLCLTVVALAAATLDDVTTTSSGGDGLLNGGDGGDTGDRVRTRTAPTDEPRQPRRTPVRNGSARECSVPDIPGYLFLLAGLLVVGVGAVIARKSNVFVGLAMVAVLLGPLVLGYNVVTTGCKDPQVQDRPADRGEAGTPPGDESGGGGGDGTGDAAVTTDLPMVLLAVLAVIAVAAVGTFAMTGDAEIGAIGGADEGEDDPDAAEEDGDVEAVGEAAGRAADRIEDAADAFDNEIYRAWVEMTEPLEVDHPDSSTPAEFASAAVAAGMDREDVDRLTRLFEAVRYGDREVTDEREREAVELLRRIERTYGDDGGETA